MSIYKGKGFHLALLYPLKAIPEYFGKAETNKESCVCTLALKYITGGIEPTAKIPLPLM